MRKSRARKFNNNMYDFDFSRSRFPRLEDKRVGISKIILYPIFLYALDYMSHFGLNKFWEVSLFATTDKINIFFLKYLWMEWLRRCLRSKENFSKMLISALLEKVIMQPLVYICLVLDFFPFLECTVNELKNRFTQIQYKTWRTYT